MTRRTWLMALLGGLIVMGGLLGLSLYYVNLPDHLSQHETIVLGQQRLIPGTQAALRVIVRDSRDATPLPNATVNVLMRLQDGNRAIPLFEGRTNVDGNIDVRFTVPENAAPEQMLIIETRSDLGSDSLEHPVRVQRDYRIHIATDKPLYQPGDVIHIRVLALSAFDRRPAAEQPLGITVTDARGNVVFRQTLTTSKYGVAATDFRLAHKVNSGPYQLTATLDETIAQKTITVLESGHATIPDQLDDLTTFDINMTTDHDFYRPGERVAGTLHADYAFGKPIVNGDVTILGSPGPMISATVHITGQTDASGNFDFALDLPAYEYDESEEHLDADQNQFYIEAHVSDTAYHTETHRLSLPIPQQALSIEAVPEGGQLHPSVENILYVMTRRPDGTPVKTNLIVRIAATEEMFTAKTGPYGLAEVHFTPQASSLRLDIEARAPDGATAQRTFDFAGAAAEESVLLRPAAPLYRVGDTMRLTILTSEPAGTVYLDINSSGQTVSSRTVPVIDGQAEMVIDLTPDLDGTLHLHAYKILRSGETVHDTRIVVVEPAHDLNVRLTSGASVYRPGDTATVNVQVTDAEGMGLPGELGLAIVDESTFTPLEHAPDIARLAFLLKEELLTPKYELRGLGLPDMIGTEPAAEPALREAQLSIAKASLAAVAPAASPFTLRIDSQAKTMERASTRQSEVLAELSLALTALFLLIPLIILAVNGVAMWRTAPSAQQFWRRVGVAAGSVLAFTLLLSALPMAQSDDAGTFERLTQLFEELAGQDGWLQFLMLVGVSGLVTASIFAVRHQDRVLSLSLELILLFGFIVGDLLFVSMQLSNGTAFAWPTLLAIIVLAVSLLLRAVDFILARRLRPAIALSAVTIFLLVGMPALINYGSDVWQRDGERAGSTPQSEETSPSTDAADDAAESKALPSLSQSPAEMDKEETPRLPPVADTLLWLPNAITDENGALQVEFPVADSIATWRMTALASAQDGRLGSATSDLRVYQDFFIQVDLPASLTVGDQISVPVAIYNYLPEPQTLQLEVEQARWFELLGAASQEIDIAPNDVTTAYFSIRVLDFGLQPFQVTAWGSAMSDALRKEVRVVPNGKERRLTRAGLVTNASALSETITLPDTAIPGTQALTVKLIPGVVSHLIENLDALLRLPTGAFEPTASATYPSALLLDYLQATGQSAPEAQMQAAAHINAGYQRLTTFEAPDEPGGFSRFGQAPADPMLTAYGLQAFSQMQHVHPVDPALVDRMAAWLFEHQRADGSWASAAGIRETECLPATAFILWGLADGGYASDARAQQAAEFLLASISETRDTPGYTLALVANALVAMEVASDGESAPATEGIVQRLSNLAIHEGDVAYWESGRATYLGNTRMSADLETTAMAALALFRAERHVDVANAAVRTLIQNKDSFSTWHTTSATAMALRALLASAQANAESAEIESPITINVTLNGGEAQSVQITPETLDVVRSLTFEDVLLGAANTVDIQVAGQGDLTYQVVGQYYVPWDKVVPDAMSPEAILLNVAYDHTELAVGETVEVAATAILNPALVPTGTTTWAAESTIIEVGLPPGFEVQREDLGQIVSRFETAPDGTITARIERFELTGNRIIFYVANLTSAEPLSLTYRLRAKTSLVAQTPASIAYDAYNPDVTGEDLPQTLTVLPAASD